nr:hypothetical protein [Tanacetum cinerariifolium]
MDQNSHTQTPGRQIFTGHKFSSNKNFTVYKKTSPRSDLRWKPTGRIFKSVGCRWLPTGKLFDSCTSKVEQFKLLSVTDLLDAVSELLSFVSEQGLCML